MGLLNIFVSNRDVVLDPTRELIHGLKKVVNLARHLNERLKF
jgi:hypothetical protein